MRSTLIALAIVLTFTLNTFAALKAPLEPPTKEGSGKPLTQAQSDKLRAEGKLWQPATELWRASELSLGVFSAVSIDDIEHLEDHVAGYGLSGNYFFTKNIGVGLEARTTMVHDETWLNRISANVVYRIPIGRFAPYGFAGAGYRYQDHDLDPRFYAGAGGEVRLNGNLGAFADGRIETKDFKSREPFVFRLGIRLAL